MNECRDCDCCSQLLMTVVVVIANAAAVGQQKISLLPRNAKRSCSISTCQMLPLVVSSAGQTQLFSIVINYRHFALDLRR